MPCKLCRQAFKIVPCEHPTGVVDIEIYNDSYEVRYVGLEKIYKALSRKSGLKNECPCKECLVSPICIHWCDLYMEYRGIKR